MKELVKVTAVPPLPQRKRDSNKGDFGRVLVVGGSRGMAGAPTLAARAAYRSGAGLVRVVVPRGIWDIVATKLDECMTDGVPETGTGSFSAAGFPLLARHCEWANVTVIGPGVSQERRTAALIRKLVAGIDAAIVLDADGLNAFQGDDLRKLKTAREKKPARALILTPHPGEMGRLLKCSAADVQEDRLQALQECCENTGAVVVLKGADTLVSDGRRVYVNATGNPGMATGGTGDVLSGIVAALLGQKMEPFEAACLGVYLHGLAGDLGARRLGVWSLIAGDLIDELPNAFLKAAATP